MTIEEKQGLLKKVEDKRKDAAGDDEFHRGFRCGLDAAQLILEDVVASTIVPVEPPLV